MKALTQRQQQVLAFIEEYVRSRGFPPSVRDIATHLSLVSASGVHKHIKALVRKNYLSKQEFTSRSLRVLRRPGSAKPLPAEGPEWHVTGVLGGGRLRERPNYYPADLRVPAGPVGRPASGYAIIVEDDAYANNSIRPGDTLLISPQVTPAPADLLLVEKDGSVALRTNAEAAHYPAEAKLGVLVGLWRTYRAGGEQTSPA
jgi:SOS-response transcriptional repressor LexA